jgi:uncharacterized protein YdeI (YjbR/CyaY-like superfamily)
MDGSAGEEAVHRQELEIVEFADVASLRHWLEDATGEHAAVWVRVSKSGSQERSVTFLELLEEGIAWGWSESTRRSFDEVSYLQRFGPRRGRGTSSERNLRIADRLEREGRMTEAGRRALRL